LQHTFGENQTSSLLKETTRHVLKKTKKNLDSSYTCLEAFLGFLVQTKMKVYTKLTVGMCCPICDRRSLAPSSGNFCRRLQGTAQVEAAGGGVQHCNRQNTSELMFGMLGLVSAKAWPSNLLREVE
jgi:hypothetical protein